MISTLKPLLQKIFDIRREEASRALILFGYIFLIITSHLILKSMTRSLFLKNIGPEQLPLLYILVAVGVGALAVLYSQLTVHIRLDVLIGGTSLFLMGNLLIFWWLLTVDREVAWLYYGLYIWVSLYGVLTTSQFWLLANSVFNSREARRIFPILAAGAILGGIAGGYLTHTLVKRIGGTENLALFCVGFLGMTIPLVRTVWDQREKYESTGEYGSMRVWEFFYTLILPRKKHAYTSTRSHTLTSPLPRWEVFSLIYRSRHLAWLAGLIAVTEMVSQIADFQFSTFASERIKGTDELTRFLGFWLSNLNVVSLLFQVLFAGTIIQRFGVGVSVLFLPLVMLGTSIWVFLSYGLVSILATKFGDGAFRYSINKAGIELLFLPIPPEIKKQAKTLIDMLAGQLAQGISGVLLLIFYNWLGLSVSQISLVSIVLTGVWLFLARATYREYIRSFRQALAKRQIDADTLVISIEDEATVNTLRSALTSSNKRQVIYALRLLESVKGFDLTPSLQSLLSHPSAEVRLGTLRLLGHHGNGKPLPQVQLLLNDPDEEVRREALRYIYRFSRGSTSEMLIQWLQDKESNLRGVVLYCIAEQMPGKALDLLTPELVRSILTEGREAKVQVADALGMLLSGKYENEELSHSPTPIPSYPRIHPIDAEYHSILLELLEDSDPEVRSRALHSMGQSRSNQFLPILLRHLGNSIDRKAAREALATYGNKIVGTLSDYLRDENISPGVRRGIPYVLSLIGNQHAVDALLDNLFQTDKTLRYHVIKGLNKLRARHTGLRFDHRVDEALLEGIRMYYRLLSASHTLEEHGIWRRKPEVTDSKQKRDTMPHASHPMLLKQALSEHLEDYLEGAFRLLGLRYPSGDIYDAYTATTSTNGVVRASAIEFLDNILPNNLKSPLLPVIEKWPVEQILQKANGFLSGYGCTFKEVLESLATDSDSWLRTCTLYEIGVYGLTEFQLLVESAKKDEDLLVRETATFTYGLLSTASSKAQDRQWTLRQSSGWETDPKFKAGNGSSEMYSTIEKVIFLQDIDIFSEVRTDDLAHLAAIAEEVSFLPGMHLYQFNDPANAFYLILSGKVRLHRDQQEIGVLGPREAVGTWSLFDNQPRVATATAMEETQTLRVTREDFYDLLSDHVRIAEAVLRSLARRLRSLAERIT
jgi:AAA family ATP:ADP antiporter